MKRIGISNYIDTIKFVLPLIITTYSIYTYFYESSLYFRVILSVFLTVIVDFLLIIFWIFSRNLSKDKNGKIELKISKQEEGFSKRISEIPDLNKISGFYYFFICFMIAIIFKFFFGDYTMISIILISFIFTFSPFLFFKTAKQIPN